MGEDEREEESKKSSRGTSSTYGKTTKDAVTLLENFLWKCSMGYTLC